MKRNRTQTLLPITISFFILVFPLYFPRSYSAEANLFFTDLGFENPDPDDQVVDQQQDGSKAFVLDLFYLGLYPEAYVFKHSLFPFANTLSYF